VPERREVEELKRSDTMYQPVVSAKPRIQGGHEMRRWQDMPNEDGQGYEAEPPKRQPQRRDHRGNLLGGRQNETMQAYQFEETLEQKEHKRWLAHKEAALHATFPTSLMLNGVSIPISKYDELEILGQKQLRGRALNLRDALNASKSNFFGHNRHLTLNSNESAANLIEWIIECQVIVSEAVGAELTHADFGTAPGRLRAMASSGQAPPSSPPQSFPWSQHGVHGASNAGSLAPLAPASFPWSQHGINDDLQQQNTPSRTPIGAWRAQPPTHQGFSLVPPHLASGSPAVNQSMIDMRANARRGHGSSVMLG